MRVAAIYDIHGNLPALEAVLHDIRQAEVDLVVVGGDVFPGPMPRETLTSLLDLDIPVQFIYGNGDRAVLAEMAGTASLVPEQFRHIVRWVAQQLQPEDQALIAGWPDKHTLVIEGLGEVLFCHATPRNDTEIFTRLTPEERLSPIFGGLSANVVVCGHTHMQFDWLVGKIRIVNAGSVGSLFGAPGAYWLLLGPDIQFQHTLYNLTEAAERIRATDYPVAQDFAAQDILQPVSEEKALEMFTPAELK